MLELCVCCGVGAVCYFVLSRYTGYSFFFFFSSRRRHTRWNCDWSSDVCSSDLSSLAERTDQHVGNVSHHIRALAEVGLVEEAPELAKDRRERWWRLVARSLRWRSEERRVGKECRSRGAPE